MPEGITKEQLLQLLLAQISGAENPYGQNPYPTASGNVMSPYNVASHYITPQDFVEMQRAQPSNVEMLASPEAMMFSKEQAENVAKTGKGLLDLFKKKPGVTFGAGNYIIPKTQIQSMPNLGFSSRFSGNLFAPPAKPKFSGNLFGG